MAGAHELILGESPRTLDDRYRLSLPSEMAAALMISGGECILAKERPGSLSLWDAALWRSRLDAGVALVEGKIQAGKLAGRMEEVQLLGRLLSTRHKTVQLAGRGRLLIPEGFREFLGVQPREEVLVVGAAICVEIWRPQAWVAYLETRIPEFQRLFDQLSG